MPAGFWGKVSMFPFAPFSPAAMPLSSTWLLDTEWAPPFLTSTFKKYKANSLAIFDKDQANPPEPKTFFPATPK